MKKRQVRLERIVAVDREFRVAKIALEDLEARLRADPASLSAHELRGRDVKRFRENLEATYLLRLYAEFEAGLREAWQDAFGRTTHPPMRELLTAFVGLCSIPQPWAEAMEKVREYRNSLVHEGSGVAEAVPFPEVRRRLCQCFSRLPVDW